MQDITKKDSWYKSLIDRLKHEERMGLAEAKKVAQKSKEKKTGGDDVPVVVEAPK